MLARYIYIEGLTNLIESDGKYLVNIFGQIKDVFGNDLKSFKDKDGHLVVNVLSWDGQRDYKVMDLMALQFKLKELPIKHYDKIITFPIDGDKENCHAKNVGYRFIGGKLEVSEFPGFYYIPGYPRFGINQNGDLLNIKTKNILSWYVTKPSEAKKITGGYRINNVYSASEKISSLSRHRSLCLVFKGYPDNVDFLVTNHLNGIPGDDCLDNLEWVTRKENNTHAYETNLRTQNIPVLIRNIYTGEVKEYHSISRCSEELGYKTDETIRQRIVTSKFGQVFQDGTQVKLKNDPREWIIPKDPNKEHLAARQRISIKSKNYFTGEIKTYNKILDAGRHTGVNTSIISHRVYGFVKKPALGYQFKELSDNSPWPDYTEEELKESLKQNSLAVDARNLFSGESKFFSSTRKAALFFMKPHITTILGDGRQPLIESGWQFKYHNDEWEEIEDPEELIYKLRKDIMAREETTGRIIISDNSVKLGRILSLKPRYIRKASLTRGEKLYEGYRFRLGVSNEPWPTARVQKNM